MAPSPIPLLPLVRFGPFEFDARAGELRKFGIRIKLNEQPVRILVLLLQKPGEVVLREEIRQLLWPTGTVVEFDHGINVAIQKLRDALGESAEAPRYVETVARRGYRFIGEVEHIGPQPSAPAENNLASEPPPQHIRALKHPSVWMGAVVLTAIIAFSAGTLFRDKPGDPAPIRFSVPPPAGTAFGGMPGPAVSPDGRWIAFATVSKDGYVTWLRSLAATDAVELADARGGALPFWSPDSRSIGFFAADGKLKRLDLRGPLGSGEVRTLCNASGYAGGTWNASGVILFANEEGFLNRVSDTGGTPIPVSGLDGAGKQLSCRYPRFMPDGRHFVFESTAVAASLNHATIRVGSLDSRETKVITEADSNAVFVQGRLLYVRDKTLVAQPFDPRRLAMTGDPVPLADQISVFSGLGNFSAAQGGPLVYLSSPEASFELAMFDRNGKRVGTLSDSVNPGVNSSYPNFSPDGKSVALDHMEANNADIWIYNPTGKDPTRLTFDAARDVSPVWSPEGKDIAFASSRSGHLDLFRKASDGSKPEQLLYADDDDKFPTSWSPDGKFLLFDRYRHTQPYSSIWVLPLTAPLKPFPLLQTPVDEARGQFSPDGRWIAYQSLESGEGKIYVARFDPRTPLASPARQISAAEALAPRWRKDGKEIFYFSRRRLMAAALVFKDSAVEVGKEREVIVPGAASILGYDVSPDGNRFVLKLRSQEAGSRPMTVVQNWAPVR